jgi:lysophospholipase L1-like esterase
MKRFRRKLVLLFPCLLFAACVVGKADPDPLRFESEIGQFQEWDSRNSFPGDAILFIGSSSIRLWQTARTFADLPVVNRGFGGAHISDVNHFINETTLKYRPGVIVFYAGDNDIWDGKEPEHVADDFGDFLRSVWGSRNDTQVLFISIKPSRSRWSVWDRMREANSLIRKMADSDKRLTFVDIAAATIGDDGLPESTLFVDDQLHLNEEGYARWESEVGPALTSMYGRLGPWRK